MSDVKRTGPRASGGVIIQFNLVGLVVFGVSLVVATGLVTFGLHAISSRAPAKSLTPSAQPEPESLPLRAPEIPPWGELIADDIELEQPEEYLAFELENIGVPAWHFIGRTPQQVQELLLACGLSGEQVQRAMSRMSTPASGTVIKPDDQLVFGLGPEIRARLYRELGRHAENHYIAFPFLYPGQSFDRFTRESGLDESTVQLVRRLLYLRGETQCFSDYEAVMGQVPSPEQRLLLLKALSRQFAVLPRLRIRPETDVEKLIGYWSRGTQAKDARPLLASLKRLPDGGSVNLLHLLPPFARQRLYTFPLPSQPGDPAQDCHWSTLNFFNEKPDDRFAEPRFVAQYVHTNYYKVAKANLYGDIIFFLNENGTTSHSAVYIADDIVFTKNGNNMAQPWMLVRLKDLLAKYGAGGPSRVAIYRNKNW